MKYATIAGKNFLIEHAVQGEGGWVCKTTKGPIQHVVVRQVSGEPAWEPGDRGTYQVDVAHVWCPACGGKKPDVAKLQNAHVAENSLVPLH